MMEGRKDGRKERQREIQIRDRKRNEGWKFCFFLIRRRWFGGWGGGGGLKYGAVVGGVGGCGWSKLSLVCWVVQGVYNTPS